MKNLRPICIALYLVLCSTLFLSCGEDEIEEEIIDPPIASFSLSNNSPTVGEEITTNNTSIRADRYEWIISFPNGNVENGNWEDVNISNNISGIMTIELIAYNSGESDRFSISIEWLDEEINSSVLTALSGTISDGSGAADYADNLSLEWLISPGISEGSITISFNSFDTEEGYDFVRIYEVNSGSRVMASNSNTLIGEYSGNMIPADITVCSEEVLVQFETDGSETANGWGLGYQANEGICSDETAGGTCNPADSQPEGYRYLSFEELSQFTRYNYNAIVGTHRFQNLDYCVTYNEDGTGDFQGTVPFQWGVLVDCETGQDVPGGATDWKYIFHEGNNVDPQLLLLSYDPVEDVLVGWASIRGGC